MRAVFVPVGLALIVLILVDGFEAMVLPRRVSWTFRPTRLFYRSTWAVWAAAAGLVRTGRWRQFFLSVFGPLSLLALLATWVAGLVLGFALLHWSLGTALLPANEPADFWTYLYLSGDTFFTLGYGDVTPAAPPSRILAMAEAGTGFGFMALIIGYLPVLYQAFSRREVGISVLDARAGSPPSAGQFLLRVGQAGDVAAAGQFLAEWERWCAELLESTLSFPVLSYYRSQHDNQSWVAALTATLDTCALLLAGVKGCPQFQAQLTFAMARHAAVDLAMVFRVPPRTPDPDRLGGDQLARLREALKGVKLTVRDDEAAVARLAELRGMYEPFVNALACYFLFTLPPILPDRPAVDNWQTSAWMRRVPGLGSLPATDPRDDHFD
jgi:hypothetical protein